MTDSKINEQLKSQEMRHKPTREEAGRKALWKQVATGVGAAVGIAIIVGKKFFGRSGRA